MNQDFEVILPETKSSQIAQNRESCDVRIDGELRNIRFHDYDEIYKIPGFYEHLFYEQLKCHSPQLVCNMLTYLVKHAQEKMSDLTVLDMGAGNGMMAAELRDAGVKEVVGVDILPEARMAAERDRPGIYDAYYVADLTDPPSSVDSALQARKFDCMTLIAALGFGDIPPTVFSYAYNLVEDGGWIAFNIKENFLDERDTSKFSGMVASMIDEGRFETKLETRYVHRESLTGDELHYIAFVGRKIEPLLPSN